MTFMDDVKTDQKTQIMVAGMLFFALAFPGYFYFLGGQEAESYSMSGPVGNYSVTGTYSYHQISDDSQYINDGESVEIMANSDAAGDIKGKNIVGVRATLTFTDDETQQGFPGCAVANGPVDDDVTGHIMHAGLENTSVVVTGENLTIEWYNSSIIGTTVSNMSESQIEELLENVLGLGVGEHILGIAVNVNTGGGPGCQTTDDGEEVAYTIELISLDYKIEAVE